MVKNSNARIFMRTVLDDRNIHRSIILERERKRRREKEEDGST